MSQARNGFVTEEGGSPFFIERPVEYLKEEYTSDPFKYKVIEQVIDIPYIGMFVRYEYKLLYEEKCLERFHSLEVLPIEELHDQFKGSIEEWFKKQVL